MNWTRIKYKFIYRFPWLLGRKVLITLMLWNDLDAGGDRIDLRFAWQLAGTLA